VYAVQEQGFLVVVGERAAGFLHDDTPQQKLDKLDALLAQSSTSIQDAALIAESTRVLRSI